MDNQPLAYFITFTCRGAWLHGDQRGSVDREHNIPGTPFLPPDPEKQRQESAQVQPYLLDSGRRDIALKAIMEIAKKKPWTLWAVHVRSNHIHVVVGVDGAVERVMNDIKTAISRRLNKAFPAERDCDRWTRHGSTRYLWKEEQRDAAIHYTVEGQGTSMAVYDGRADDPSRARSAVSGPGNPLTPLRCVRGSDPHLSFTVASRLLHGAMVVAVIAVRVMQMAVHQVIDMVAVRDLRMAAIGAVLVGLVVSLAAVLGRALGRIGRTDGQGVLLDLVAFDVVQMAVVQIIDMAFVHDASVAAAWAVLVRVPLVMVGHDQSPSCEECAGRASSSMACASAF